MIGFFMKYTKKSRSGRMVQLVVEGEHGYRQAFVWLSKDQWEEMGCPKELIMDLRLPGEE